MNDKNKIAKLTIEELMAKKKQAKSAAIGLGIVLIIAVAFLFYIAITTQRYAFIGVAVGCSVSFVPMFIGIKIINDEIKSRESK